MDIAGSAIGENQAVYFVADIAANHDGDLERAKDLIYLAAEAGADAAKFQNFLARSIVSDKGFRTLGSQQSHQNSWKKSVYEVYDQYSLPLEWTRTLRDTCAAAGIHYFTSPYDLSLIDMLDEFVVAWKLGSGDITWHEMIDRLARGGKPLLMASGASCMEEVRLAIRVAQKHTDDIVLMQCNTNYTASLENFRHIALNVLKGFAKEFPDVILGLSDHTPGHATTLGAVALGARVIEKHFTDDCSREGPDHKFAMTPTTWREMVDRTRELELALGSEEKRVMDNELETKVIQRRAVRAARDLARGETLSSGNLVVLRPCPVGAVPPYEIGTLLGRTLVKDIPEGEIVRLQDLQ